MKILNAPSNFKKKKKHRVARGQPQTHEWLQATSLLKGGSRSPPNLGWLVAMYPQTWHLLQATQPCAKFF
jgi:hypothetical protein